MPKDTTKKQSVKKESKTVAKPAVKKSAKPVEEVKKIVPAPAPIPAQNAIQNIEDEGDEFSPEDFKIDKDLASKPDRYFEAIGRRKTAVARVRLFTRGEKEFLVNNKPYQEYFTLVEDQQTATASMKKMKCLDKFKITSIVKGGGRHAQAEAVRHGTARVLVDFNNNFRKRLRKAGYLTRDPRMRERKKFGLKRARKAPQWAKR